MNEYSAKKFIDEELKLYSAHSNVRGIPFVGDGLKQAQRKAIWGFITRGEGSDKDTVERIAARCASDTDYHHGVGSLEGTIVSLAQSFSGSNNAPLIEGFGQFGNRLNKKPASSRYIKAKLSPNFRKYFKKEDDLILQHHYSNGDKIEPLFFIPILPMSLINGSEGLGTGHATYILQYNPDEIISCIKDVLKGKKLKKGTLKPWFNGFTGKVSKDIDTSQIEIRGVYKKEGNLSLRITELPIGIQSDAYENHLYKLIDSGFIKSFVNASDEEGFDFEIAVNKNFWDNEEEDILKKLKLISKETENLTLWDVNGVLKKYSSVEEIIEEFVQWRIERYEDRRRALIKRTEDEALNLDERIRFINYYLANHQMFRDNTKKVILETLQKEEFTNPNELLNMPIWSLTKDRIEELTKHLENKLSYLNELAEDTAEKMYSREI